MGCMTSKEDVVPITSEASQEEWDALRKKLVFTKSKFDAKRRDKIWDQIDRDRSGALTYAEVERELTRALGLDKVMPIDQLRPVLVRAFNAAKTVRVSTAKGKQVSPAAMALRKLSVNVGEVGSGGGGAPPHSAGNAIGGGPTTAMQRSSSVVVEKGAAVEGPFSLENNKSNGKVGDAASGDDDTHNVLSRSRSSSRIGSPLSNVRRRSSVSYGSSSSTDAHPTATAVAAAPSSSPLPPRPRQSSHSSSSFARPPRAVGVADDNNNPAAAEIDLLSPIAPINGFNGRRRSDDASNTDVVATTTTAHAAPILLVGDTMAGNLAFGEMVPSPATSPGIAVNTVSGAEVTQMNNIGKGGHPLSLSPTGVNQPIAVVGSSHSPSSQVLQLPPFAITRLGGGGLGVAANTTTNEDDGSMLIPQDGGSSSNVNGGSNAFGAGGAAMMVPIASPTTSSAVAGAAPSPSLAAAAAARRVSFSNKHIFPPNEPQPSASVVNPLSPLTGPSAISSQHRLSILKKNHNNNNSNDGSRGKGGRSNSISGGLPPLNALHRASTSGGALLPHNSTDADAVITSNGSFSGSPRRRSGAADCFGFDNPTTNIFKPPTADVNAIRRKSRQPSVSAMTVTQKERFHQLQREEFRLFLMYVADYLELYCVFSEINTSAGGGGGSIVSSKKSGGGEIVALTAAEREKIQRLIDEAERAAAMHNKALVAVEGGGGGGSAVANSLGAAVGTNNNPSNSPSPLVMATAASTSPPAMSLNNNNNNTTSAQKKNTTNKNSNKNNSSAAASSKNDNKTLSPFEFVAAIPKLKVWGIAVDEDNPINTFYEIDKSRSGTITFKEFSDWVILRHMEMDG